MLESDKIWEPREMQHWVGKKHREWFYPPWMTGIDTLFLMNADRAIALDGLMESLQRLKSPMCLSAVDGKATSNEWTKVRSIWTWLAANGPQCSKIENQENGREFEIGIIGNVAQQHDADTIYKSVPDNMFVDIVRLSYLGH